MPTISQAGLWPVFCSSFGAHAFGVPTIGHERCRDFLLSMASTQWSREYILNCIQQNPRLEPSYTAMLNTNSDEPDIQVCVPTLTFSQRMRLAVDGLTIELEHVGVGHAPDSLVVRIPEESVLFLGDCYYALPLHLRTAGEAPDWAMLESLLDDSYEWYIEGHDLPHTLTDIRKFLADMKAAPTG